MSLIRYGLGRIPKLFSFTFKHWYLVITLFILIPSIISSVSEGYEQRNPMIPIGKLSLFLTIADNNIYEDMQDTSDFIPKMKTENKIEEIEYWSRFFWNIIKKEFVNFWMILFNFIILYKFFKWSLDSSKKGRNLLLAFITLFFFQMFISLILIIIGQMDTYIMPEDLEMFGKMWFVIKSVVPFKGVFQLISFIFKSIFGGI